MLHRRWCRFYQTSALLFWSLDFLQLKVMAFNDKFRFCNTWLETPSSQSLEIFHGDCYVILFLSTYSWLYFLFWHGEWKFSRHSSLPGCQDLIVCPFNIEPHPDVRWESEVAIGQSKMLRLKENNLNIWSQVRRMQICCGRAEAQTMAAVFCLCIPHSLQLFEFSASRLTTGNLWTPLEDTTLWCYFPPGDRGHLTNSECSWARMHPWAAEDKRRWKVLCCRKPCTSGKILNKLLNMSVIKGQILIC